MSSWVKTLVVLVLMVPMTAYVVGSLSSSGAGDPADRGPVIIEDPSVPATTPTPEPSEDRSVDDEETKPRDDHSARVVTPKPVPVDDRDDDDDRKARVVTPKPVPVDDDDDQPIPERDEDDDTTADDRDEDDDDDGDDDGGDD